MRNLILIATFFSASSFALTKSQIIEATLATCQDHLAMSAKDETGLILFQFLKVTAQENRNVLLLQAKLGKKLKISTAGSKLSLKQLGEMYSKAAKIYMNKKMYQHAALYYALANQVSNVDDDDALINMERLKKANFFFGKEDLLSLKARDLIIPPKEHTPGKWMTDYDMAKKIAKKTQKPILIYFYMEGDDTSKLFLEKTLSTDVFLKWAKKDLILFKCVEIEAITKDNEALAKQNYHLENKFSINSWPSTLFTDGDGDLIFRAKNANWRKSARWVKDNKAELPK